MDEETRVSEKVKQEKRTKKGSGDKKMIDERGRNIEKAIQRNRRLMETGGRGARYRKIRDR